MTTLHDLMTSELVTVTPETSLREALEILVREEVTGLPVMVGSRVVGVVSATDILEFEATTPPVPAERSYQVEWGGWEDVELHERAEEVPASYYSDLWPDVGADVATRFGDSTSPEWDLLTQHTVADVMTSAICALPPDATLPEAAAYMRRNGIHRVLVMKDEQLIGIVTASDVMNTVADTWAEVPTGPAPWEPVDEEC